ncbi:MAG TPA: MFS transporter, partial [Chitinophagaceae bacterium]
QFYAQTFLLKTCNIEPTQANTWMGIGLLLGTPFFVVFGSLSDKIGRKIIMLAGMLIALLSYRYIFTQFYNYADTSKKTEIAAQTKTTVTKEADAKNTADTIQTTTINKVFADGSTYVEVKKETFSDKSIDAPKPVVKKTIVLDKSYQWKIIGWIFVLVIFVTMVYGPIAAFLVELFPTQIRYTSMSLPYHIGNGVFGGLVPFIGTLIYEYSKTKENPAGNVLAGLWYPIVIAAICFIIGALYLRNTKNKNELTH